MKIEYVQLITLLYSVYNSFFEDKALMAIYFLLLTILLEIVAHKKEES